MKKGSDKVEESNLLSFSTTEDLKVFHHGIYEYKKGVRDLILITEPAKHLEQIKKRLITEKISFVIQKLSSSKINVFFGASDCILVVRSFGTKKLNELSPEQDFMLGIMLGYSRKEQCKRFLMLKEAV